MVLDSSLMIIMDYGPGHDCPWSDRELAKRRFVSKLQNSSCNLSRLVSLRKVHLKNNGYSVLFFFNALDEDNVPALLTLLEVWSGPGGQVRKYSDEECGTQMFQDGECKQRKKQLADMLGDLSGACSLLEKSLALQGNVSSPTKCQKRAGQLAVVCFVRAQGQVEKELNGKAATSENEQDVSTSKEDGDSV